MKRNPENVHALISREKVGQGCDPRQPAVKPKAQHRNFGMLKDPTMCDQVVFATKDKEARRTERCETRLPVQS